LEPSRKDTLQPLVDHIKILAKCDEAIALNPKDSKAYFFRGIEKFSPGSYSDYKGAIADFDKAIELDPNFADAYTSRGLTKHVLKDYKGALADYDKAIKLDPNNTGAYDGRGIVKCSLGDYKGAIEDSEKAIQLDPTCKEDCQPLIDKAKVIVKCDKAIELNPNDAEAYLGRGNAKYHLGDYEGAIKDYERAIQLNSSLKSKLQPAIDEAKKKLDGKR
ncbi:tetratricopeptide repeat protein, partial [Candidatus Peregrinibacteria bacterium]|nr:tetratricopeptide repeat protein [Candidatus Peregrinibacteria bacterium]